MQHLAAMRMGPPIEALHVEVFRLPTLAPVETDGTAAWSSTTMVMVQVRAADAIGLGYSYVDAAAAVVIQDLLESCVIGTGAFALPAIHIAMVQAVRNHGRHGIAACAIAAVDTALWDLQARLLGIPLCARLGAARDRVPVYASGGFTSTTGDALVREIESYRAAGHRRIKIKIGRLTAHDLEHDLERVRLARDVAGPDIELMVDANGAYTRKQARMLADELAALDIIYFEEPVSSDDLEGLRLLRDHTRLSVAAGEYGYDAIYFRRMLEAGAVDILQADATRCLGITGFLQADALCDAFGVPLSAHCAPALHAHAAAASRRLIHIEHFFDHVRMESLLFDGVPEVRDGALWLDTSRPGHGLELRRDAALDLAA